MTRIICPAEGIDITYGPYVAPPPKVVEVIPRTTFAFDGRASGTTQTIVLAEGIDARRWVSAISSVRLYSKNTWTSAVGGNTLASAFIRIENTDLGPDAPGITPVEPNGRNDSTSIVATTTAPNLFVKALFAPIGPRLRVSLLFTQGALVVASNPQTLELGVTLVGRRGG